MSHKLKRFSAYDFNEKKKIIKLDLGTIQADRDEYEEIHIS